MNKVILIGRTTRDVELRRTASNMSVATFTLAVDKNFKKDDKSSADFINCVAWNNTADFMDKYVKKGSLVAVEGRIQTRNYDDKDGKRVYVTEVVVENLKALDTRNNSSERNTSSYDDYDNTNSSRNNEAYNEPSMNDLSYDISDDDLPF